MIFVPLNAATVPNWQDQKDGEAIQQGYEDYEEEEREKNALAPEEEEPEFEPEEEEELDIDTQDDEPDVSVDSKVPDNPSRSIPENPFSSKPVSRSRGRQPEEEVVYEEDLMDYPAEDGRRKISKRAKPEMYEDFESSNLKSVAYDSVKEQLWVRFKDDSVYTYYDVPVDIWRGFWTAKSKGHYFWEKIRRDESIEYQRLSSSKGWTPVSKL